MSSRRIAYVALGCVLTAFVALVAVLSWRGKADGAGAKALGERPTKDANATSADGVEDVPRGAS
jgi:hypothetical protein